MTVRVFEVPLLIYPLTSEYPKLILLQNIDKRPRKKALSRRQGRRQNPKDPYISFPQWEARQSPTIPYRLSNHGPSATSTKNHRPPRLEKNIGDYLKSKRTLFFTPLAVITDKQQPRKLTFPVLYSHFQHLTSHISICRGCCKQNGLRSSIVLFCLQLRTLDSKRQQKKPYPIGQMETRLSMSRFALSFPQWEARQFPTTPYRPDNHDPSATMRKSHRLPRSEKNIENHL